ncbi:E3 ubiquitin-protein ligase TRIM39-like [Ranitomeya variabilis]|uniref:E3 ubiquitin-protein ligase TRIM39-like n=1 Tax=Ranitomeya variabilis TaxID=490064 RepID=UPI0040570DF7
MASADVRDDLDCAICLNLYNDPVTLRCGHNFCRVCIDRFLNTQDGSGAYSCPECRAKYKNRPSLIPNITLRNVAERFRSTQPHEEEIIGICCTYCIHAPVPAVKSCLHCEASLCDNHLKIHSKGPEHVLTDPSTSLENKKCSVHKELFKYYCIEDAVCICASCSLAGQHRGHWVEMLDEASEKKKEKLKNFLQTLITKRMKTEQRVRSLEEQWRKAQEKADGDFQRATALFTDSRRRLDHLEKRVLSDISRREEEVSLSLSDVIQKLEIKKDELSKKMRHIEELCNMTDPQTVLEERDTGDFCDPEEVGGDEDTGGHDGGDEGSGGLDGGDEDIGGHKSHDVDIDVITGMLHAVFSNIISYLQNISSAKPKETSPQPTSTRSLSSITQDLPLLGVKHGGDEVIVGTRGARGMVAAARNGGMCGQGPADILVDVNTAVNKLTLEDLKTASGVQIKQNRPEAAEIFQKYQVISGRRFTSGRHYRDVEIGGSELWSVGMCYPSIDRRGDHSHVGYNNKSWGLYGGQGSKKLSSVIHDSNLIPIPHQISSDRFRIYLDYEAGQLSFYELCVPIRHLHTFTATFSEPLHVFRGGVEISGGATGGTS